MKRHLLCWQSLLAALLATLLALPVNAAPQLTIPWLRDMQVTVYARRALADDPELSRWNLGVNVRDGIATVWGPVPNDEVGRKAVKAIEQVRGVMSVRSDLYPLGRKPEDDLPAVPLVSEAPTKTESASPDRESGRIARVIGQPAPLLAEAPAASLHSYVSLGAPVALAEDTSVRERRPSLSEFAVHPNPPAIPRDGLEPITPRPAPAAPVSRAAIAAPEGIIAAINRLRLTDERFRPIATEVKDGAVTLRGGAANGEHVMAFAQAIAQVAGVERVVVQSP